jgi:hypothetical protein
VTGRGEPNWQPISMLATIASLSDEGLRDAREHYATLLEARPKPHVPEDATIARTKRVNGESLEWCDVYDRQLARWQRERLTRAQCEEVARLQGVQGELRAVLTQILELADELARGTIERQLAKSDPQVGMFSAEIACEAALAAMIAVYLADLADAVQIAPPILAVMSRSGRNQARLAPLERAWTLPATEAAGVRT